MLNIETTATALRSVMEQDRNYSAIQAVPYHLKMEVGINDVPARVADDIRSGSPYTKTVLVGMFARKGKEFLSFTAGKGSKDGFPSVSLAL